MLVWPFCSLHALWSLPFQASLLTEHRKLRQHCRSGIQAIIRECVSHFGPGLGIPTREDCGFVPNTHAALVTLWHWSRLLDRHSRFCAHRHPLWLTLCYSLRS
jgi:hypothetical protein